MGELGEQRRADLTGKAYFKWDADTKVGRLIVPGQMADYLGYDTEGQARRAARRKLRKLARTMPFRAAPRLRSKHSKHLADD
jgi:hypothetical protein